ncbi:hypothetical protein V6N11_036684 [Hibiscus sabdariffa]|uniref:phosphatidate phosphatase n=1 Tax=Hibiscus sabdariffa TaxID=183260 RepID=A0ABR2RB29_9ROSI
MNVVGKVGSLISQGVYSVATPFHPFGGAVDVIVVRQQDGTFRSTPWYVRFGKFQGVLKGAEKVVHITVNGVEANFHMCLDNSGEAYFARVVDAGKGFDTNGGIKDSVSEVTQGDGNKHIAQFSRLEHSVSESRVVLVRDESNAISSKRLERAESDTRFYEFQDEQSTLEDSINLSELGPGQYEGSDGVCLGEAQDIDSEVVLFSVDGHVLTVPKSESEQNVEDVRGTPRFHIGPDEGPECCNSNEEISLSDNVFVADCTNKLNSAVDMDSSHVSCSADSNSTALRHDPEVSHDEREHAFQTEESPNVPNHQSEYDGPSDVRDVSVIEKSEEVYKSCLKLSELGRHSENIDPGDKPTCISPNFNESKDEAINDSQSENVSSSSNNNGSPALQAENKVLDSDYLGSNIVSICSVRNESQGKVEQLGTSESTEGINSSLQSLEPENKSSKSENIETESTSGKETAYCANPGKELWSFSSLAQLVFPGFEMSLCGNQLHAGMKLEAAATVFEAHHMSNKEYKNKESSIIKNADLNVQFEERYLPREKAPSNVLGTAAVGSESIAEPQDVVPVEQEGPSNPKSDESTVISTSSTSRWKLWPIPFIKGKTVEQTDNNSPNEKLIVDTKPDIQNSQAGSTLDSSSEQFTRTNVPTTEQIASLNLKDGQNMVIFSFSTRVFGNQQVDAHLYLWKWNDKIVISDVDGTITKSDVLGQFMPLVGRDWTQSGVAKLFSAIKCTCNCSGVYNQKLFTQPETGSDIAQDGKALPSGPVVISPDGLFPSLYREGKDIKNLFPSDHNPFYAGFGNRDTDEFSYRKIGIPKGKIFIINPKGEVANSQCINTRSYTSLHTLVDDMFPPPSLVEQVRRIVSPLSTYTVKKKLSATVSGPFPSLQWYP